MNLPSYDPQTMCWVCGEDVPKGTKPTTLRYKMTGVIKQRMFCSEKCRNEHLALHAADY